MKAEALILLTISLLGCASAPDIPNASMDYHPGPLAREFSSTHPGPDRWDDPAKFECHDRRDTLISEISIERSSCYGFCSEYTLTLFADGHATYEGRSNMSRVGQWTGQLPPGRFEALAMLIEAAGFFSWDESQFCAVTDNPTAYVAVVRGGARKLIKHYAPDRSGPPLLAAIEELIDLALIDVPWKRAPKKAA